MAQDLINIGVVANFKRNKIPSFSRIESVLDSKDVALELIQVASYFLDENGKAEIPENINLKNFLDDKLNENLAVFLKSLNTNSFLYRYLALILDFTKLRQVYQKHFSEGENIIKSNLLKIQSGLLLKNEYEELDNINRKLSQFKNSFEVVTALDKVFFNILKKLSSSAHSFTKKFIALQIDTYNITAFFRLNQLNKTENIQDYLVDNPDGISIKGLNLSSVEALVSKVINFEGVINSEKVELAMKKRELNYLKKAIFEGYGEPVVILYIELLKVFFYDIKLIAIYHELHSDKADLKNHLINYDLK